MKSQIINPKDLIKQNPVLETIDLNLCVDCKAVKSLCGLAKCPLLEALDVYPDETEKIETISDTSVFGPSPQIFVGSRGYPRVNSGPLTVLSPETSNPEIAGNPSKWVDLSLKEIISLRYGLIRGMKNLRIKPYKKEKLYHQLGELTLATNAVDVESQYMGRPRIEKKFDAEIQPMGPSGVLRKLDIASNPKIPKKVDSIINDELKANQQITTLYSNNYDVYYLQNVLSSGITGLKENAKLVPTRWSITATDDIIGKELIRKLEGKRTLNQIEIRQGDLLGNYFTVILLPGKWTFENFETWVPGGIFTLSSSDWKSSICSEGFSVKEYYKGRTSYASQAGGYYATRLAILEHLSTINRQAKVVVIREISPEYVVPVGVWAVREGVRKTMKQPPVYFNSQNEVKSWLKGRLVRNEKYYFKNAQTFFQTSLDDYF